MVEVSEGPVRGRPRLGWMNGEKVALGNRALVHMELNKFHAAFLLGPVFFLTAHQCSGGYRWRRVGCRFIMRLA